MPLIENSSYHPPWPLTNGDLSTVLPTLTRRIDGPAWRRERLELPDGDFLDLDTAGDRTAGPTAVLCHGLEGSARAKYVRGMAQALLRRGWRVVAMNYRGCSGEPNRLARAYHSGATDDLAAVVEHAAQGAGPLALVGFSLGGNLVLRYLGEAPSTVHEAVSAAVAVSAPVDLAEGAACIDRPRNRIYVERFLRRLRRKVRAKAALLPPVIDADGVGRVRTLTEFDDRFTAPVHGFKGAADYYARCSARPVLAQVRIPALLLNAGDDPFLGPRCRPREIAAASEHLHLELPRWGGHVGFMTRGREYWSETRIAAFLAAVMPPIAD